MAQILEIVKEGTLKTQIMYKANLSFTQLNEYLQFMLLNNLINHTTVEGRVTYTITEKGTDFLQMHTSLLLLLKNRLQQAEVEVSPKNRSKPKNYP